MRMWQRAAVLLACSWALLASPAGGVPDRFRVGSSHYRVRASFTDVTTISGEGIQRESHESDVIYRQSVTHGGGGGGWEVRVTPEAGCETTVVGRTRTRSRAERSGGATLIFSRECRLVRVEGLRYDSETAGPAFLLLPLAATRGGAATPARGRDRDELVVDRLGEFTLEVSAQIVGAERASGRNCRVVEITLSLPAGELVAAGFNVSEQSKDYAGAGNGTVQSRVWIDAETGEIVGARGTFRFHGTLTSRRSRRIRDISAHGAFQANLLGTPGGLTP